MFADTADHDGMRGMYAEPYIKGFITNQTLMRQTGVTNYEAFAKEILTSFPDQPIRRSYNEALEVGSQSHRDGDQAAPARGGCRSQSLLGCSSLR